MHSITHCDNFLKFVEDTPRNSMVSILESKGTLRLSPQTEVFCEKQYTDISVWDRTWRVYNDSPSLENRTTYVVQNSQYVPLIREDKLLLPQKLINLSCVNHKYLQKYVNNFRKMQWRILFFTTIGEYAHTARDTMHALRVKYSTTFQGV